MASSGFSDLLGIHRDGGWPNSVEISMKHLLRELRAERNWSQADSSAIANVVFTGTSGSLTH